MFACTLLKKNQPRIGMRNLLTCCGTSLLVKLARLCSCLCSVPIYISKLKFNQKLKQRFDDMKLRYLFCFTETKALLNIYYY